MQVVTKSGSRKFYIIPSINFNTNNSYKLEIKSEQKNKVIFTDTAATFDDLNWHYSYNVEQDLTENSFYTLEITNTTDNKLEFRDKIFCTNQNITSFTISKNVYVEAQTGDNEYIYYGE
jgi:hypothetical protein